MHLNPPVIRKIQRRSFESEMTGVKDDFGVGKSEQYLAIRQ
jgi:hypothetical protein